MRARIIRGYIRTNELRECQRDVDIVVVPCQGKCWCGSSASLAVSVPSREKSVNVSSGVEKERWLGSLAHVGMEVV